MAAAMVSALHHRQVRRLVEKIMAAHAPRIRGGP
jgi:hypothetical protein